MRDTKICSLKLANKSFTFTSIVASVINKSFQEGVFPEQMKIARVTPIHKEGAKTDVGNYRPISILYSFSKIYYQIFLNQMIRFMKINMVFALADHASMPFLMTKIYC